MDNMQESDSTYTISRRSFFKAAAGCKIKLPKIRNENCVKTILILFLVLFFLIFFNRLSCTAP